MCTNFKCLTSSTHVKHGYLAKIALPIQPNLMINARRQHYKKAIGTSFYFILGQNEFAYDDDKKSTVSYTTNTCSQ